MLVKMSFPSSPGACVLTVLSVVAADREGPACGMLAHFPQGCNFVCVSTEPDVSQNIEHISDTVGSGAKQICFLQLLHLFQLQRPQTLPLLSHPWAPCPAPPPALRFCPLHPSTLPLCPPCPSLVTCPAAPSLSLAGMWKIRAESPRHTAKSWSPSRWLFP